MNESIATLRSSSLTGMPTSSSSPFPFASIAEVPDIADRNCRLLGLFSLWIQGIMGFIVLGTLVLKRQREKPKRPWKIWTLDISKQMLGQLFVHSLNILLSSLGSIASEGANNPCSLYFLNIAIDTTVGVLFIYFSMRFLTHYFTDVLGWPGFVSGQYTTVPAVLGRRRRRRPNDASLDESIASPITNEPHETTHHQQESSAQTALSSIQTSTSTPSAVATKSQRPRLSFFFRQLSLYLLSLLLMKIGVVILFALLPFLFDVGRWVLSVFGPHKKAQIFFVMAVFPLAMNTLQFWLIDSLLRHNPLTSIYRSNEDAEADGNVPTSDYFQGARPGVDGTASETGQGRLSWWTHSPQEHRDGSRSRLMGGDEDNDDSSRDEEHLEDGIHAYPPTPSATSSVAQLDAQDKSTNGQAEVMSKTNDKAKDEPMQHSPASDPPTDAVQESQITLEQSSPKANDDDEDDAWDNWNEDNKPAEQS